MHTTTPLHTNRFAATKYRTVASFKSSNKPTQVRYLTAVGHL